MDAKLGVTVFNSISKGVDALHRQLPFLFSLNINAQIQETAFFLFFYREGLFMNDQIFKNLPPSKIDF